MRTTSAAAKVERMKNGPRSRAQISASSAPQAAASKPPSQRPIHGVISAFTQDRRGIGADAEERGMPKEISPA